MKLTQRTKLLVGFATIWPFLYIGLFFSVIGSSIFISTTAQDPSVIEPVFGGMFALIFPLHCLTMIVMLTLMGFYIWHIITNKYISDVVKVVFAIGTFMFSFIAMPIYFVLFVWRDDVPEWAAKEKGPNDF